MTTNRSERSNVISAEAEPIAPAIAASSDALTFAQTRDGTGRVITLLVTALEGETVEAIDLTGLGAAPDTDVFDVLAAVGETRLRRALSDRRRETYRLDALLSSGAPVDRHLATGTNFAEHAREAGIGTVFHFPKFGEPTPARSTLPVRPGTLMDYEVEISVRFDRDIHTMQDFTAARKGFFLCGDFTDRALMMRLIDPSNIASGHGFSDSKSGPGYFPTGPFLVVPHDWRDFVARQRIVTRVNGAVRQDARGREMILDFEALVADALDRGSDPVFVYRGRPVALTEHGFIPRGSAVMSGTSEGVIFMPPTKEDRVRGMVDHLLRGRFLRGMPPVRSVIEHFIANEARAGRYLQAGDRVEHLSSSLGTLSVELTPP